MKMPLACATVASALLATSTAFAAGAEHFYIGAALGGTTVKDAPSAAEFDSDLASIGLTSSSSVDDTDTGWKLFGGYMFNRNLAVEASYADLGELNIDSRITAPFTGNLETTWEAWSLAVSAVGIWPLAYNFDIFGKAGLHYWDAELKATATAGGGVGTGSDDDNGTDVLYGIGAAYNLTDQFALRAEWERYTNIGDDNSTGESDVDMWSAGVQYSF